MYSIEHKINTNCQDHALSYDLKNRVVYIKILFKQKTSYLTHG